MKAMIPHHSSAILTSQQANITDPEVRKLADDIIKAQEKEIAAMKNMLNRLQEWGEESGRLGEHQECGANNYGSLIIFMNF